MDDCVYCGAPDSNPEPPDFTRCPSCATHGIARKTIVRMRAKLAEQAREIVELKADRDRWESRANFVTGHFSGAITIEVDREWDADSQPIEVTNEWGGDGKPQRFDGGEWWTNIDAAREGE